MNENSFKQDKRNDFVVAFYRPKFMCNVGSIIRTADVMGSSEVAIIDSSRVGKSLYHASDTARAYKRIAHSYDGFGGLMAKYPDYKVVAVEMFEDSFTLGSDDFVHPDRCIYIMGSEDCGIPESILLECDSVVTIPTQKEWSLNVAEAASMVMWDRVCSLKRN